MTWPGLTLLIVIAGLVLAPAHASAGCVDESTALPVSRIVEIDTTNGPMFGSVTRQPHEPSFLRPKEVVLTFDDGPMPWVTKSILGTLDTFCTKATFFSVGRMALAYPATVKDILARGHTLGSHTYSHPFHMPRMKPDAAVAEIERGLAAVTAAAGEPIAPFFRFPGLADSPRLLAYLRTRNIAALTVDVVSNDSYTRDPLKLAERTMAEVRRHHGGIILFHDIKTATAKALPSILARLKAEGYSVVHMTAKHPAEPLAVTLGDAAPQLANLRKGETVAETHFPLHGAIVPLTADTAAPLETSSVSAAPDVPADHHTAVTKSVSVTTAPLARQWGAETRSLAVVEPQSKGRADETSGPPVFVDNDRAVATTSGWITNTKPSGSQSRAKAVP